MEKFDRVDPIDVAAALPPVAGGWNKVIRRGEFDVQVQAIFEHGDGFKSPFRLRIELQIDIDGLLAKAQQQRGRPARQIHFAGASRRRSEFLHELPESCHGYFASHGRNPLITAPDWVYCLKLKGDFITGPGLPLNMSVSMH